MLHLIATPIGNLSDITLRALETLKKVDCILCEDTRHSKRLLDAHDITTPLRSYHKFSEKKLEESLLEELRAGKEIALISDAGTPGINDPGQSLVLRCRQEGLPVTSLPGASSPIVALSLSGLPTDRFQFLGFVPKKASEKRELLISTLFYPGVSIFFESPKRIEETLQLIDKLGPEHRLCIARELSKLHEEVLVGTAGELLEKKLRGEIVLLIEGNHRPEFSLHPKEHVLKLQETFDLSKQEAIKIAAQLRGVSKKSVYSCLISGDEL